MSEPFNGWTNYDSWAVGVVLDNDEALYKEAYRIAARYDDDERLATALETWVRGWWEDDRVDLNAVNWLEIAEMYHDE